MRRLPYSIIACLLVSLRLLGQNESPHGQSTSSDCTSCHSPEGWTQLVSPMDFNHNDDTEFLLNGAHGSVDCKSCHTSLVFSNAQTDCASCHEDVHSGTVGRECQDCHSEQNWLVDIIPELHEQNGFPLAGTHATLACIDCHANEVNLRFDRLGNDCINCHLEDFNTAQNPNHIEKGYSTDCLECHDILAFEWDQQLINHNFFPLVGGHDAVSCNDCHVGGGFDDDNVPNECVGCHLDDYNATTQPNHVELRYSKNCEECHTIFGWEGAIGVNHDFFPLVQGHAINDCAVCHLTDNFSDTSPDCISCHQDDYDGSRNPDHARARFSTDCTECHTIAAWEPSTLDHDGLYFPITNGNHRRGVWNQCTECHIQPTNYAIFSCIDCHEHSNRNEVDDDHDGVNGYRYESTACLECHPQGNE